MESLRKPLGQLILVGFHETQPDREFRDLIRCWNPGGVILFRRNVSDPDQILRMTESLQDCAAELPLFVAIDQEGGKVTRLPEPFTQFPASRTLGRSGSAELVQACAEVMARELRAVGINFNLAPVLDVDTNPRNPIIGSRSFGPDPAQVARLGLAVLKGFRRQGILGAVKHFPGHGDTSLDSHLALPIVDHPRDRLDRIELAPFRELIAHPDGAEALMTAHVVYPSLDPVMPATLSEAILTTILRLELRFRGIVLTDDLEMRAITDRFGPEEACLQALRAGADQILFCHTPSLLPRCLEEIVRAIGTGLLSEKRIHESLGRIRSLKETYLQSRTSSEERRALIEKIGCREHLAVAEQARRLENNPPDPGKPT